MLPEAERDRAHLESVAAERIIDEARNLDGGAVLS